MIARIWKGVTTANDADSYHDYLQQTGVKQYKTTKGNRRVYVLRKIENNEAEFVLISLWESFDAIKIFAGEKYEEAVFYPEDERFLIKKDMQLHILIAAVGVCYYFPYSVNSTGFRCFLKNSSTVFEKCNCCLTSPVPWPARGYETNVTGISSRVIPR